MSVVDASALVEMLLQTELGRRVEDRLLGADELLHSPHLVDVAAVQALRNLVFRGSISRERARAALGDLTHLPILRHAPIDLLPRLWELRANLTAYDATYVALAEALNIPLVTCNEPLSRSPGHGAVVECIR